MADLDEIQLHWADNSTVESGYRVERRIGAGAWGLLASLPAATQLEFTDQTAQGGTTYDYSRAGPEWSRGTIPSLPTRRARRPPPLIRIGSSCTLAPRKVARDVDGDHDGMTTVEEYLFDRDPQVADRYPWSVAPQSPARS